MNRNALIFVAAVLLFIGGVTVYYLRPIDEATKIDFGEPESESTIPAPKKPEAEDPTKTETKAEEKPPVAPVVPVAPGAEVDLSADGVRKYTPLPMPAFFATDGLPKETQPINPLDFAPAGPKFVAIVKELVAAVEAKSKDPNPLRNAILFLCRAGRPNEAAPYFDRYIAAGGTMKDLGEIVIGESGKNAPGEAIGGGLEFYIRGLAMIGRFDDANARQKELDEQYPGYAESGLSTAFLRFYELFDQITVKKNPVEAMYALEKFNSVWPTGRIPELENQAGTLLIRMLTEAKNEDLEEMLPKLNQVWPHLPSNTMQLITQDLLKRGARPSPFMIAAGDPVLRDENCNPAALIRRSQQSRFRAFDLEQSMRQARRARVLAQDLKIPELELAALWNLADVAHAMKDLKTEVTSIRDAETLSKNVKQEGLKLYTSLRVGALYEHLADEPKAMDAYLAVYRKAKERSASVTAFRALNAYCRLISRFAKPLDAQPTLKEQAEGFEKANASFKVLAEPSFNLAYNYQRQRNTNEAAANYAKVLQSQDVELGMRTYLQIGQLCLRDKNGAEAEKAFTNALETETQVINPDVRWRAAYGLARSRFMLKDIVGARQNIVKALTAIESMTPSVVDYQQRRALQDDSQEAWEFAIELAVKDGEADYAFELAERCRARAIQDVFGTRKNLLLPAKLANLKAAGGPQKTILYLSLPDNLMIWVVSANEVAFERIPLKQQQLFGEVNALLKMATVIPSSGTDWQPAFTRAYERLWRPIAKHIKDGDRVSIVPHGILNYVPFAALHDGEKYLVEKNELHVAPTAGALLELLKHPVSVMSPGLLFDPAFSTDPASEYAQTETAGIAQLFPLSKVLKGNEASATALLSTPGNTALLHLSAHGQFDTWLPARSGFEVWREGQPGVITLEEIVGLRIPSAQLIAFNSSPTGIKDLAGGDDAAAVARAFHLAGARNVLCTLWKSEHAPTIQLMKAFYENLKNNPDPTAALCAAQRTILKTSPHPFAWGGFIINGAGK